MSNQEGELKFQFNIGETQYRFVEKEAAEQSFMNNTLYEIPFFGFRIGITETIQNTWIIMGALVLLALIIRMRLQKFQAVPRGLQNFIEFVVESFTKFTRSTMGPHNRKFAAFYMSMFLFIMVSNLSGLLALRPPTADIATTFALSMTTFFMIHFFGIKTQGLGNYFKGFFKPMFLLFPINLIGELAIPVSLAFRLFGNILGGAIIMALVYSIPFWPIQALGLPAVLHTYFDVFAGLIQAFIFVMLSMTFVSNAISHNEN